jgi:hypothetical protein
VPNGKVTDQQRRSQPAAHRGGHDQHLILRDLRGSAVAEHHLRAGIAGENEINRAALLDRLGAGEVVGGHHHDRRPDLLLLAQPIQRDRRSVIGARALGSRPHGSPLESTPQSLTAWHPTPKPPGSRALSASAKRDLKAPSSAAASDLGLSLSSPPTGPLARSQRDGSIDQVEGVRESV